MRAFLAFDVADDVIQRLLTAEQEMRTTGADVGVVSADNLHFTVRFLGEVPDNVVDEISTRIGRLELQSTQVRVEGVGAFPGLRNPRIVWAGVSPEDSPRINALAEKIIDSVRDMGKPEDRRFHAHITIGRVRSPRNHDALASFIQRNQKREFGATRIDRLKLKSSVLKPGGPTYSDVREFLLG